MKNKSCTCTGFWSCSLITTPPPRGDTIHDRTQTFVSVYREVKQRKILTCPHFKPCEIGHKIDVFCDKNLSLRI